MITYPIYNDHLPYLQTIIYPIYKDHLPYLQLFEETRRLKAKKFI